MKDVQHNGKLIPASADAPDVAQRLTGSGGIGGVFQ